MYSTVGAIYSAHSTVQVPQCIVMLVQSMVMVAQCTMKAAQTPAIILADLKQEIIAINHIFLPSCAVLQDDHIKIYNQNYLAACFILTFVDWFGFPCCFFSHFEQWNVTVDC